MSTQFTYEIDHIPLLRDSTISSTLTCISGGGGSKALWRELKLYGGVIFITIVSLFHLFRNIQHPTKRSDFFKECLGEMSMHQELLLANIIKLIKKVLKKDFTFCAF